MAMTKDLWVFGYGSLIWSPGIDVQETRHAHLDGYRRRFCMWSIHHRGSEEDPGLVLALEDAAGARCEGLAFRATNPDAALVSLRERELISSAYKEVWLTLNTTEGAVEAVTYVIDKDHRQYVPDLTLEEQATIIARAHGGRGPNAEYLHNTAHALAERGIRDHDMERLSQMVPVSP